MLQQKFSKREKKIVAKSWLNNFDTNIQSWYKDLFKPIREIDCITRPHTASYISCYLLKMNQTATEGHKHKAGDSYDFQHIAEAAAVDVFITSDSALIRMYNLIPKKYQFVQVQRIGESLSGLAETSNLPKTERKT